MTGQDSDSVYNCYLQTILWKKYVSVGAERTENHRRWSSVASEKWRMCAAATMLHSDQLKATEIKAGNKIDATGKYGIYHLPTLGFPPGKSTSEFFANSATLSSPRAR